MVGYNAATLISRNILALFCAAGMAVSPVTSQKDILHNYDGIKCPQRPLKELSRTTCANPATANRKIHPAASNDRYGNDILLKTRLWQYLRAGINYLEASGKEVPIRYKHPGGKAYGPLALTPIAIRDVKLRCPLLSRYSLDDVLSDRGLYEKFAAAYAELLLKHYFKIDYLNMPKEEVFEALQKGWFLGPSLYKKGRPVIISRQKRAAEYIDSPTIII